VSAGRSLASRLRRESKRRIGAPFGFALELVFALRARLRIAAFAQRVQVAHRFPEPAREPARPRVLVAITHVTDLERSTDEGVARLERTLESLLEAFSEASLEIVLNTLPGRHVAESLPGYQRERLTVRERPQADPMFAGFEAQDVFASRVAEFDWFLYLEDDILVQDTLLLDKLAYFNAGAPPDALLLPHRYELWRGRKTYIDLVSKATPEWRWSRLTPITVGGWRFVEFDNPHSGCYCLSRAQLGSWLESGRRWYGRVSYVAPRESAATGCLAEVFRLYKPHPDTKGFLEVRHQGTKYAEFFDGFHGQMRADGV
jgi:hypothetical protein